ncbi:hypothetical protein [Massilia sp. 9I]|uniref:hypothetical protein n=1 Tax=Massilia sp. 9I TaxID=2653152 RepID=UPI0012F29BF3|nr:hypothetical protein [Massilia sp. 9I]VXB01392.1 putative Phasin family protein [Massilia sp. 9I]
MVQFPQTAAGLADNPALRAQPDARLGLLSVPSLRAVDGERLRDYQQHVLGVIAKVHAQLPAAVGAPARAAGQG